MKTVLRLGVPLLLLLVPALVDCGALSKFPGGGDCPSTAEAAMDANFGLKGEVEGKVKAALGDTPMPANPWDLIFAPEYASKLKGCGI